MEGTNKAHENGEAMGLVGVRLTDQLGVAGFTVIALYAIALLTCLSALKFKAAGTT